MADSPEQTGPSTGSPLADMVIARSGAYLPDTVERYQKIEERIASSLGKQALVVVRQKREVWTPDKGQWSMAGVSRGYYAGTINGTEPVIDDEDRTWALPTLGYAVKKNGSTPEFIEGNLPVKDVLTEPAETGYMFTLNEELATLPRNDGQDPPKMQVRELQHTAVFIGKHEVDSPFYQSVDRLLRGILEAGLERMTAPEEAQ